MKTLFAALLGLGTPLAGEAGGASLLAPPDGAMAAVGRAGSGDRVVLSGQVGPLTISRRRFAPPLVIDASRATVTALHVSQVHGLVICGGTWRKGDPGNSAAIRIDNSSDVQIHRIEALGPGALGQPARGYGVQVLNSRDISVFSSKLTGFRSGITMHDVERFAIEDNAFVGMSADGFIGGGVRRGMIAGNVASGFQIIKDEHPDGIQLFSPAETPPSSDVVITRNRITGDTEGIGLYPGTNERGYDRITITSNDIHVSYPPAIAAYGVRGLVLKDNRVRTLPGAANRASIHVFDSSEVDRAGNTVGPGGGNDAADDPRPRGRSKAVVETIAPPGVPRASACPAS